MLSAPKMQCFSSASGASTGGNTGVVPDLVMQSTWYSSSDGSGSGAGTDMVVRISGLDNAKLYTIGVRGSRAAVRNPFDVLITGKTTQSMDPSNNTAMMLTFTSVAPSSGIIDFTCRQQGTAGAFLDAFTITEQ